MLKCLPRAPCQNSLHMKGQRGIRGNMKSFLLFRPRSQSYSHSVPHSHSFLVLQFEKSRACPLRKRKMTADFHFRVTYAQESKYSALYFTSTISYCSQRFPKTNTPSTAAARVERGAIFYLLPLTHGSNESSVDQSTLVLLDYKPVMSNVQCLDFQQP